MNSPADGVMTNAAPTLKRRVMGLGLAFVLTAGAFAIVTTGALSTPAALATIAGLAAVQAVVHLVCFLDLGRQRTSLEVRAALMLAVVLVAIMVGGTWVIMGDLAHRMMGH